MEQRPKISGAKPRSTSGFSLLELVVVTAVILILLGVGLPFFTQAYRDYQLNDAATQVAGILKAARLEAIRRNVPVNCVIAQGGVPSTTRMWVDSDGDGVEQATEQQILLSGTLSLATLPPPTTGALAAAVGVATLTVISPPTATITFDFRGAVNPPAVYAIYLNNLGANTGFRAVILLPSGSIQVWGTRAAGAWRQLS